MEREDCVAILRGGQVIVGDKDAITENQAKNKIPDTIQIL